MRTITPQPGYDAADVRALIDSRQFAFADCYTVTPRYGDPLLLTRCGKGVTVVPLTGGSAITYLSPRNLQVEGLMLRVGIGTEADEQEMSFSYDSTAQAWGIPMPRAIQLGRLDGATISRDRFFAKSFRDPWLGGIPLFRGRMASVDSISRVSARFKIKSDLILLNIQMPRDLFQPGCVHTLYAPGCALDKDDFKTIGTVETGSTSLDIQWAGATSEFSLGMVYIDTPEGVTLVRTILHSTGTSLELAYPLDFVPSPGLTFEAYPGCNRSYDRCGEFNNQEHYKGFPFVPVAETAV